jgi:hypothetical protein
MLARYYLTYAGVGSTGGVRNTTYLDSAAYYANDVIQNSGKSLAKTYYSLFKYDYNNNSESLFELEWAPVLTYGLANSYPSYVTCTGGIGNGDGWGGNVGATYWILSKYHGFSFSAGGDTLSGTTGDNRLYTTFMMPGWSYPELLNLVNGVTTPYVVPTNASSSNPNAIANIKKYVCGGVQDNIPSAQQEYPQHTYMLRLAELYLIYAEAKLGNSTTTTDPTALAYFNTIHARAYAPSVADSAYTTLNFMDIFNERAVEFAGESSLWYDLVTLHYYNPQLAYNIINSQWRGGYAVFPNQNPNPTSWSIIITSWWTTPGYVNASSANFGLEIPAIEQAAAPNLLLPAVDYTGK